MDSKPKHVVMIQIDITCFINKFVSHKYRAFHNVLRDYKHL